MAALTLSAPSNFRLRPWSHREKEAGHGSSRAMGGNAITWHIRPSLAPLADLQEPGMPRVSLMTAKPAGGDLFRCGHAEMERPMRNSQLKTLDGRVSGQLEDHIIRRRLDTLHDIDLIRKAKYLHPPS